VTVFNLNNVKLRTGEQFRERVDVQLEPLVLGGQEYRPVPDQVPSELTVTKATSGSVYTLAYTVHLLGPCFRCLRGSTIELAIHATEYQANDSAGDEELESPYISDDSLDLSSWARDALALELPEKILHSPDCAGLCTVCGKDLNEEPHTHDELAADPRWAALDELRGQL
jgi:uncharacterized protein